jgi:hypothetical protein
VSSLRWARLRRAATGRALGRAGNADDGAVTDGALGCGIGLFGGGERTETALPGKIVMTGFADESPEYGRAAGCGRKACLGSPEAADGLLGTC